MVSNFIVQALRRDPITIYGDGSQTRSFCYVDDLIEALMALMDSPEGMTGPINFGNPEEYTILELAQYIVKLTHSKSEIIRRNLPQDDPERRKPDISLANTTLGWSPKVNLEQGLTKAIDYFESLLRSSLKEER